MEDHPFLGGALFAAGAILVGLAYFGGWTPNNALDASNAGTVISFLLMGHILGFNGALFVFLGCRKIERERVKTG